MSLNNKTEEGYEKPKSNVNSIIDHKHHLSFLNQNEKGLKSVERKSIICIKNFGPNKLCK